MSMLGGIHTAAFSSTIRAFVTPLCGLGPGLATADLRAPESGTGARRSLQAALQLLDEQFGFHHSKILLADEQNGKLLTIASHGYADEVGSEVGVGEGLTAWSRVLGGAIDRQWIMACDARAVRDRAEALGCTEAIAREIPLPGLPTRPSDRRASLGRGL